MPCWRIHRWCDRWRSAETTFTRQWCVYSIQRIVNSLRIFASFAHWCVVVLVRIEWITCCVIHKALAFSTVSLICREFSTRCNRWRLRMECGSESSEGVFSQQRECSGHASRCSPRFTFITLAGSSIAIYSISCGR